ncbi:DUF3891 family protein [Aetokthonos hydrillicola]|uniref:DUF3891 family protein n=1 Tax=Aetokthonos hydrillicola TaxID=1550245 RepID=UPI001FBA3DBF
MIVNQHQKGWEVIYHRAHALLAAQIAGHWHPKLRPIRWLETIAAISHHDEIFTTRKLKKQTKKDIAAIYRNLQFIGVISFKTSNSKEETQVEETFETDNQDNSFSDGDKEHYNKHQEAQHTTEFSSAPRTEASKKVRQIFLRLAEIFHPDKVSDTSTQAYHTEIMKEINKAYQEGDLARLLEIERQHQVGESIESNSENDLSRKCTQLEQENQFLATQYENLKRDLAQVKHTPEGGMVANCRKAKRQGIDPIAEMLAQVEFEIKMITDIRDFVRDFRDEKITVKEFIDGPKTKRNRNQETKEELFEQMLEDLGVTIVF